MSRSLTADQVRDEYVTAMPAPLGETFNSLYQQVAWLHFKWDDYNALFGEKETVDLLNATAPDLFHRIQRTLWEDIMLHLCRLTDPPKSVGKSNLTMRVLPILVAANTDAAFRDSVKADVKQTVSLTEFAREWRNKRLAHNALPTAAGGAAFVLPAAGRAEFQNAITSVGDAMNCVEKHYMKQEIGWGIFIDTSLGVLQLLHYLRTGLEAQRKADSGATHRVQNEKGSELLCRKPSFTRGSSHSRREL